MPFVLLIHSNPDTAAIIEDSLRDQAAVIQAETVLRARQLLSDSSNGGRPFAILVDCSDQCDPGMCCAEVCSLEEAEGIPVIAIIATTGDRDATLSAGAQDYLLAPLLPAEVSARLAHYLRLLEIVALQESSQIQAAQAEFIVLIARLIGERLDLNTVLSRSLEQTLGLLNADGGEIWLLAESGLHLDLVSSLLNSPLLAHKTTRRAAGQGLIGWVAQRRQTLQAAMPDAAGRYDPRSDALDVRAPASEVLATPLQQHHRLVGVLALYSLHAKSFQPSDAALLERVAALVTTAVLNARLVQEIIHYANQQRVLNEMSRQIAAGLDLQATLERSVQWIARLADIEVSLLWLLANDGQMELAAGLGAHLPEGGLKLSVEACVPQPAPLLINDLAGDPRFDLTLPRMIAIKPRNALLIPITYRSQIIGAVTLFNKISGIFREVDQTLLVTAVEMIGIAVSNARLYTQSLTLLAERERLHKGALQNERLATVGRLTASLSHEINNPLQAIQSSLTLAGEEIENSEEVLEYLRIAQQEVTRVIGLLNRMRQIYRPQSTTPSSIDLNKLLGEALLTARKELSRENVTLSEALTPNLPVFTGIADQLNLAFLSILLNIIAAQGSSGGGNLRVATGAGPNCVWVEIAANVPFEYAYQFATAGSEGVPAQGFEHLFGISIAYDIVVTHQGQFQLMNSNPPVLRITFPLSAEP